MLALTAVLSLTGFICMLDAITANSLGRHEASDLKYDLHQGSSMYPEKSKMKTSTRTLVLTEISQMTTKKHLYTTLGISEKPDFQQEKMIR